MAGVPRLPKHFCSAVASRRTALSGNTSVIAIFCSLDVCHSGKSRSRLAKKQRLQRLPHIYHSAKCERFSSSHWRSVIGKPKSRSRRFVLFCEGQGHIFHLPCKTEMYECTQERRVAVIVSQIWLLKSFLGRSNGGVAATVTSDDLDLLLYIDIHLKEHFQQARFRKLLHIKRRYPAVTQHSSEWS